MCDVRRQSGRRDTLRPPPSLLLRPGAALAAAAAAAAATGIAADGADDFGD